MAMQCPVCGEQMLVLEFHLVEIDYCQDCGGVWLDSGELELVGRKAGAVCGELETALLSQQGGPVARPKRPCPVCGKAQQEVVAPCEPPVTLDRCPRGHGIWFERGELQSVVAAAGSDPDNPLARFFQGLCGPDAPAHNG